MIRIVSMQNQKAVSNHLIKFQEGLYSVAPSDKSDMDYSSDWFRYEYESFTTAPQIWQYNMESREKTLLKSNAPPGDFDRSLYVTERIHAPIPIETQSDLLGIPKSIPISIVYRKDLFRKDGTNLLYLYGYGSYGISIDPSWRPARFSLLDRGIVFAIAHVRGGGECGRGWYEMGKFKHKKNTFTDFIACADQLVKDNYTRPELMAIDGRSAGGLLIGAVINMRPDIAHVAVLGVPFLDVINTSIIE
jgi:oligopeptidase B